MNILEVIILGIIQGLTEFIPVSSSGHLDIIPRVIGWQNPSTTLILFLHIGTLLALLLYYRKLLKKFFIVGIKKLRRKKLNNKESRDFKVIRIVFISVIPALILGVLLESIVSNFYDNTESLEFIAPFIIIPLIAIGIFFLFEGRIFKNNKKTISDLADSRALLIGGSQAIAFLRGVSRSGITLIAGQLAGLKRVEAAELSFLISIPLLLATSIYSIYQILKLPSEQFSNEIGISIIGMFSAFISGYIAVKFLIRFLQTKTLKVFGIYRIIFGILLLIAIYLF